MLVLIPLSAKLRITSSTAARERSHVLQLLPQGRLHLIDRTQDAQNKNNQLEHLAFIRDCRFTDQQWIMDEEFGVGRRPLAALRLLTLITRSNLLWSSLSMGLSSRSSAVVLFKLKYSA